MYNKATLSGFTFALLLLIFICPDYLSAQTKKPAAGKASTRANIAADVDCSVKINGSSKLILVKAYTSQLVTINVGDNSIEATTADKKSTFKTNYFGKAGEVGIIEVSFFEDGKFLDYIKQGNIAMVEAALKKDPSLATNENGTLTTSPLEVAIDNSRLDIVDLLIKNGASHTSPENIFPLHKAILHASSVKTSKDKPAPDLQLVQLFVGKGCKVNDKDDGGNTPLHCAARAGKLDVLIFLIENGADVNTKNDFDDTPLKIAEDKGAVSIMNYLKSKGAKDK